MRQSLRIALPLLVVTVTVSALARVQAQPAPANGAARVFTATVVRGESRSVVTLTSAPQAIVQNQDGWTCEAKVESNDAGSVTCRHQSGLLSMMIIYCENRGPQSLALGRHRGANVTVGMQIHGLCR